MRYWLGALGALGALLAIATWAGTMWFLDHYMWTAPLMQGRDAPVCYYQYTSYGVRVLMSCSSPATAVGSFASSS